MNSKISKDFDIAELIILQSCIGKTIEYVQNCSFEDDFEPINHTRDEVLEKLYELKDKIGDIEC